MERGRIEALGAVGICFLAVLAHVTAFGNSFVLDDNVVIAGNPAVTEFQLPDLIAGPWWPWDDGAVGSYRPVTSFIFAVDWAIGMRTHSQFLLVNLAVHCAVCLLLWVLLRRLFPERPGIIWGIPALFAVHPIHVEAVVQIVGFADLLSALFVLASYVMWLEAERRNSRGRLVAALLFWLFSLLAKEGSIGFPMLLLFHRIGRLPAEGARRGFRRLDLLWFTPPLLALALRMNALEGLAPPRPDWLFNPLVQVDAPTRILSALGILGRQLIQILSGRGFSYDYGYAVTRPGGSLSLAGVAVLIILLAGIAYWWSKGARGAAGYGLIFFLTFWLPVSNLIVPVGAAQADRFFYLPSAGIFIIVLAAIGSLAPRRIPRKILAAILAVVVSWYASGSALRARDWRDQRSLFESAVRTTPLSLKAQDNVAALMLRNQTPESAGAVLEMIEPAMEYASDFGPLIQRQAKAWLLLGETARARDLYERALPRGVDSVEVLLELGNIALMEEDGERALAMFEAAGTTKKRPIHVAIGKASALSIAGLFAQSADAWLPLVEALPDSVPVRLACCWNLRQAGREKEAEALIRAGLERGNDPRLKTALSGHMPSE